VVPDPVRERVHNVLSNIGSPVQIANDILKGKPRGAGDYCSIVMLKSTNFVTTAG
jgi:phospholipid-binding lipoprotein MlaA